MTHKGTATLETERLILRQFTPQDAEDLYRVCASDPDVARFAYESAYETKEEAVAIITKRCGPNDTAVNWAILLKETEQFIGAIDVSLTDEEAKAMETTYELGKAWWHQGFAAEALAVVIKYVFEELKINRLWASYDPRNPNSGAVLRKCGLKQEAYLRQNKVFKGELVDRIWCAILAENYFNTAQSKSTGSGAAPKYVRVQTREPAYLTGKPRGIFAAVSHLERGGKLTEAELAAYHYIDNVWFEEQLPNPPFYDDDAPGKPITWFKTASAAHMLEKLRPLMDMLDKYGTPYDVVYTNFPGRIVYEDEWQVAALDD
jgi:ribosomal-protein-alanine N-acetyltransferase